MAYELIVQTLQELLATCKDAESDFLLCAEHTEYEELRGRYMERAQRCKKVAHELQTHLIEYGGKSDVGGSAAGALHRGWLKVRGALLGLHDDSWLHECNRTEMLLLARYRRAMQKNSLPQSLQLMVERQYYAWQHMHAQMGALRNLIRTTTS